MCSACGADVTRRSTAVTTVRAKLAPPRPAPPTPAPVVEPVRRAINREPVPEEVWEEYEDSRGFLVPMPGGCLYVRRGTSW